MAVDTKKNAKMIAILAACFAVALAATVLVLTIGPSFRRSMTAQALLTSGQPATATILSLTDTGNRINMLPVMMLNLQVTPPGGAAFQSSAQEIISPANLGPLEPGRQVDVRYNPADEHLVAIVGASP